MAELVRSAGGHGSSPRYRRVRRSVLRLLELARLHTEVRCPLATLSQFFSCSKVSPWSCAPPPAAASSTSGGIRSAVDRRHARVVLAPDQTRAPRPPGAGSPRIHPERCPSGEWPLPWPASKGDVRHRVLHASAQGEGGQVPAPSARQVKTSHSETTLLPTPRRPPKKQTARCEPRVGGRSEVAGPQSGVYRPSRVGHTRPARLWGSRCVQSPSSAVR